MSWELGIGIQAVNTFNVGNRWSTAVITHTVKAHEFIDRFFHLIGTAPGMDFYILSPRKVLKRDSEREHA
jgi:hypothetical protein